MKKVFLPLNMGHLIIYFVSAFFAAFGIYMTVLGFEILFIHKQYESLVYIFSGFGTTGLFLYMLVYLSHNKIILTNEKIVITGHLNVKNEVLQFNDEIYYTEIMDVAIICANANSLKKRIKQAGYSSLRPFIYYEFTLKNEETKWVYIESFSKSQRKQILDVINKKTGLNLSYDQINRKDYSIYKKKVK